MDTPLMSALLDHSTWQKVSEHLDTLLDLEPAERQQWLNQLTGTDPATAALLEKLLTKATIAHSLLDSSLMDSPLIAEWGLPSEASMIGKQIGGYTIERLIGRGGMGAVWLASRSDGRFEGYRAIKFIDSTNARAGLIERFAKEGRLLARLSHPNIAQLIDAGVTGEGKQFLVLQYVDGERIDKHCESGSLTVEARVRLFLGAVSAVAHAHSQLVIHRDLKPSNVLVDRDGTVKLLDFGIAKLLSAESSLDDGTQTRVEESALTPDYAAPEQLLGDVPSTATDVYQLGVLLYVLLTGTHPFQLSGTRAERVKALFESRTPLASESCSGPLRRTLRGDLDAILAKALDNEPSKRYPTAAALYDELIRYLNREPVQARRGAGLYQVRKFVARHRLIVGVSATALVALCATAIFAIHQARVARTERDRAVSLASRNASVNEFMSALIADAASSTKPVTVSEMLARSEKLALASARGNPENQASILGTLAELYIVSGDTGKPAEIVEHALALLSRTDDRALRSQLTCLHAAILADMGQVDHAISTISQELGNKELDHRSASVCLQDRAFAAERAGDADGALSYATLALNRLQQVETKTLGEEANALSRVANGHRMKGDNAQANRYFELALRKYAEAGREHSSATMVLMSNWANVSIAAGVPKRALELYDQLLRIAAEHDPQAPPPPAIVNNRGRALEEIGRFAEARNAFELGRRLASQSKNITVHTSCLMSLASIAQQSGDKVGAQRYLAEVNELIGSSEPAGSPIRIRRAMIQGVLDLAEGNPDAARAAFDGVLAQKRKNPTVFMAALGKAETDLVAGNTSAATDDARAALRIATSLQGGVAHSSYTGRAWLMLGRALQASGEIPQARKAFEVAVAHLSNTVDADHPELLRARQLLVSSGRL